MKIVIPVSGHDVHLLDDHLDVLRHFGGLEAHSMVFAPAMSVRRIVEEAVPKLTDLCGDISFLDLQFEGDGRWPESPNRHWTMTMEALAATGNTSPVFWNELDCTANSTSWASDLEAGWRAARVPFYGKIVPTPHRNDEDQIVFEPGDMMMMGCAVYAADITRMPNWHTYTKGFLTGTNPIPFDVFLRGFMVKMGWADTRLIGDRWNTVNYRMENGVMVCDPGPTSFKGRDHSKTDISGAGIIHGCKDGTLARIILDGTTEGRGSQVANVAREGDGDGAATLTTGNGKVEPSQRGLEGSSPSDAHGREAEASGNQSPPIQTPHQDHAQEIQELRRRIERLEELTLPPEDTRMPEPNGHAHPDIETIRGMVCEKRIQIGKLAEMLSMDKEELRGIIGKPESRLSLVKGWVGIEE